MRCEFSETQFSFCYTFELIQKYCPWSLIPFFPNTYLEGQPGYGYDVAINGNLFLQYKIPEYITRKYARNPIQWNTFNQSFYRIKINTDGEQFNLLKQLKLMHNEVFYITPDFHKQNQITENYLKDEIVFNSSVFSIDFLPPFNSGKHNLCYLPNSTVAHMFSEPLIIKKVNLVERLQQLKDSEKKDEINLIEEAFKIKNILSKNINLPIIQEITNDEKLIVNQVHKILLSYLNIFWIPYKV